MFSKKDLVDLIKRTPRENAGKLSFDYSLPTPDRDFGETRGGKPKWAFDFQKRGGLAGWIQRAKDFDEMRGAEGKVVSLKVGSLPGDVSEERLSDADKERAKKVRQAEKMDLLQKLIGGQGQQPQLLRPISRPGSMPSLGSSGSAFRPGSMLSLPSVSPALTGGSIASTTYSVPISPGGTPEGISPGPSVGMGSGISFMSESQEPIQQYDEAVNPQGFSPIPSIGPDFDEAISDAITRAGYEPHETFIEAVRSVALRPKNRRSIDDSIKIVLDMKPVDVEIKQIQKSQVKPEVKSISEKEVDDLLTKNNILANNANTILQREGKGRSKINKYWLVKTFLELGNSFGTLDTAYNELIRKGHVFELPSQQATKRATQQEEEDEEEEERGITITTRKGKSGKSGKKGKNQK